MNFKKPKFWDYKKPNIFAYLLLPISWIIKIVYSFRFLIKRNIKYLDIKTICVGNIYLGGTGKTSLALRINEVLKETNIKTCFIKKDYIDQVDEQEILKKNGALIKNNNRNDAIKIAIKEGYQVAIFDDGLQDLSIDYDLSFVCFNSLNWIGNGMTIPAGPLREGLKNLKNHKHIFLNGNLENLEKIKKDIIKFNPEINIHIGKYIPINLNEFDKNDKYLAFSGIGNHKSFISMLNTSGLNIVKDIEYPDHYNYSNENIEEIMLESKKLDSKIITTEKDFMRLKEKNFNEIRYIKSKLQIQNEEAFLKSLTNFYE